MSTWTRWAVVTGGLFTLTLVVTAQPAQAAPINKITGRYGGIMPSAGTDEPLFLWTSGVAESPDELVGTGTNNMLVDVTNFTAFSNRVGLSADFRLFYPTSMDPPIVFDIVGDEGELEPNDSLLGTGMITALVDMPVNPTVLDLSPFGNGGILMIEFKGIKVDRGNSPNGRATWPFPAGDPITITWTLVAIPEPASVVLVVSGLLPLTVAGWLKRRRRPA